MFEKLSRVRRARKSRTHSVTGIQIASQYHSLCISVPASESFPLTTQALRLRNFEFDLLLASFYLSFFLSLPAPRLISNCLSARYSPPPTKEAEVCVYVACVCGVCVPELTDDGMKIKART